MSLNEIQVPLFRMKRTEEDIQLWVYEIAGRFCFVLKKKGETLVQFDCYFDDLQRAWVALGGRDDTL